MKTHVAQRSAWLHELTKVTKSKGNLKRLFKKVRLPPSHIAFFQLIRRERYLSAAFKNITLPNTEM